MKKALLMRNSTRFSIQAIALAAITSLLCGCANVPIVKDIKAARNRDRMAGLRIGMSQEEVLGLMGKPWKSEAFLKDDEGFTVLYYLTQRIPDGATTDDEMTPIVLKEGQLVGWGRRFFSDVRVEVKHVGDD